MERDESAALASAILEGAGWRAINSNVMAGRYVAGDLVGGTDPKGESHIKNVSAIQPGDPRYGPDTPDEPHEAAQWLVDRFKAQQAANALHTETVLPPPRIVLDEPEELAEDSGDEKVRFSSAGEGQGDCEEALSERLDNEHRTNVEERSLVRDAGQENPHEDSRPDFVDDSTNPIDAEFSEPAPELGQELAEEHPEEFGGAAFIFGDNLDQKRTAAIGLVMRHARSLMPFWTTNEDVMLRELRNYAAGVGEGRWPYDEGRRRELDALEAALARMNDIARVRDEKVSFLEQAKREEIEAFDPEAGWPQ